MAAIPLNLMNKKEKTKSRKEIEGKRLLFHRLFKHDFDQGQPSSLVLGQPGGCKTAVDCSICEFFMNKHSTDRIFWRSAINAPIQFVKLPKWHIFIEKNSGIRLFDRKIGKDITEQLEREKKITYFSSFDDLYNKAKPGICNGIFFKDLHLKGVRKDDGTIQWFRFTRFLLNKFDWCHIFFDEYQELVKAGQGERMWHEINNHSDDVSSARKTHVGIHANCHQTAELDHRVLPSFMICLQLYGARNYKHNMVNKRALSSIREPNESIGADAWISEGNRFGIITFDKVYKIPNDMSIAARIIPSFEHTKVCPACHHTFIYHREDQIYCNRNCQEKAYRVRKKEKKGNRDTLSITQSTPSYY